ncbi:Vesicle-associated membrane protein [Monoraphidium neglectum]|uniref:Vesicle-associated membrane protein n=1 Tax=Monoraphidium neglectum TaxID=145388 RepID=A0A0D2NLF7_9CHLO|nr:Vesicle-associated membrane protein [Monoraphidium neglectum]KIZ05556.1 Vesicle-associated membrane protein [Monoraphidium neglectum]|eukprot:XP_013904575.1 Vesicle-associated membrane protein [Monoraphidium neglectum]
MVENIEQVLARGDRIQLLVDRTEDLQAHAQQFQKQGRQLRNRMWWQNTKMKLCFALIILIVLIVIVLIACFSGGNRCIPKKEQQPAAASPTP